MRSVSSDKCVGFSFFKLASSHVKGKNLIERYSRFTCIFIEKRFSLKAIVDL